MLLCWSLDSHHLMSAAGAYGDGGDGSGSELAIGLGQSEFDRRMKKK